MMEDTNLATIDVDTMKDLRLRGYGEVSLQKYQQWRRKVFMREELIAHNTRKKTLEKFDAGICIGSGIDCQEKALPGESYCKVCISTPNRMATRHFRHKILSRRGLR